uniref:C2H2-type domain-containing protein n=1 Tax=Poecilia mexicana TaxID=48701 RepID=A0A3B3YZP9_9TELE
MCEVCGKAFYHASHLARHALVHQEPRPFSCSTCGRRFTQAANLRSHQATHAGEKQLCSVCGKSFRCLRNHMISRHGNRTIWVLLGRRSSSGPNWAPVRSLSRLPHRDLFRLSVIEPDRFWGPATADRLYGAEPFQRVQDCHLNRARIRWFLGGKRNVSVNCLDVHVDSHPDQVALIWERDEPCTEFTHTHGDGPAHLHDAP